MKIYLVVLVVALGCKRAEPVVLTPDSTDASATVDTSSGKAPSAQSPVSRSCGITGQAILTDAGIGELRIGRPADDVKQVCDVVSDGQQQGSEGSMERVILLRVAGDIVTATIVNDKVWRVAVTTPRILTADSLGVDSPLPKVAAMRGAQFHPGEDGIYAFVASHCALSFRFSLPLRPPQGGNWTAASIAREHADAAVDRVLLTGCRK